MNEGSHKTLVILIKKLKKSFLLQTIVYLKKERRTDRENNTNVKINQNFLNFILFDKLQFHSIEMDVIQLDMIYLDLVEDVHMNDPISNNSSFLCLQIHICEDQHQSQMLDHRLGCNKSNHHC